MTFDDFVGLPYSDRGRGPDSYDCWGLVRAVYKEIAGIDLPSFAGDYTTAEDRKAISALIAGHMSPWVEIPAGSEKRLDAVLMSEAGVIRHIGVVVKPGRVLHVASTHEAKIEDYRGCKFARRLRGFYRYDASRSGP